MLSNSLKPLLFGAVIYVGGVVIYLLYMLSQFDGFCRNLEFPGLAEGGNRPCSFYEFFTTSLETPFWPYTFWHAVTIGAFLFLFLPALVRLTVGHYQRKARRANQGS
jgi:predicted membrane channel-forming protein YqfA (hemolysin III family)